MCLLYVSLGLRVSPSIFGLMFMGSVLLSICSSSCVLYSAGSGVKRVHVVLSGLKMKSMYEFHVGMIGCLLLWCLCRCVFFLYCDDVRLGAVYEVFSSLILFLMSFMLIRSMTMFLSIG